MNDETKKRSFLIDYKERMVLVEYLSKNGEYEIIRTIEQYKPEDFSRVCVNNSLYGKEDDELLSNSELSFVDEEAVDSSEEIEEVGEIEETLDIEEEEMILSERLENYTVRVNKNQVEGRDKILNIQSILSNISDDYNGMLEDILCIQAQIGLEVEDYIEEFENNSEKEI